MNQTKEDLIRRARETYRDIAPCSTKRDFSECFTTEGNNILFWFNTADKTTHMMTAQA